MEVILGFFWEAFTVITVILDVTCVRGFPSRPAASAVTNSKFKPTIVTESRTDVFYFEVIVAISKSRISMQHLIMSYQGSVLALANHQQ